MNSASHRDRHVVCAPVDGRIVALSDIPDAAFAAGLVGAGLAIDPIGTSVVAPCAGILRMSGHAHAFTIETPAGDVLVHIGIDTVALAGEGFERLRDPGSAVNQGDVILTLDLDRLAVRAPSLVSPVLAIGCPAEALLQMRHGGNVRAGEPLYSLPMPTPSMSAAVAGQALQRRARIRAEHGLHARPAAALVAALRPFTAEVVLEVQGRRANARSVTALMGLATQRGDVVSLIASGVDAAAALDAIAPHFDAPAETDESPGTTPPACLSVPSQFTALVAVRGSVTGPAFRLQPPDWQIPIAAGDAGARNTAFTSALARVTAELSAAAAAEAGARREVLEAHLGLLADPQLQDVARRHVSGGDHPARAWQRACREAMTALRATGDRRMAERAADLEDVSQRVIADLLGVSAASASPPAGAILLADDLLPSQLLNLDRTRIAAVVTARGGTTAHVAILAAGLGLPMLVAAGEVVLAITDGTTLIVDGDAGQVEVAPDAARLHAFHSQQKIRAAQLAAARAAVCQPAILLNGEHVSVECNLGRASEAAAAAASGADGVGLLRTEFLFLDRSSAPTVAEQIAEYSAVSAAFAPRPVTIRILDVGGDKPLPFIQLPSEDNPALGLRGLRTGFANPALLQAQLDALAATPGPLRVLLPMVNDVTELRAVRALLAQGGRTVSVGVMIETPASVLLADGLAAEADFFSIGSNDLAQYVLAIDRLHPTLGAALDGLHPAVLRAMHSAAAAAARAGRPVAVCGGLGADPEAIPLLIGMGIRELSVATASLPMVKQLVRELDPVTCAPLLAAALNDPDAGAVRRRVRAFRARGEDPTT